MGPSSFLYVALMVPLSPGAILPRLHLTSVQPQEDTTSKMTRSSVPVLVTVNVQLSGPSLTLTSPKSWTVLSQLILSCPAAASKLASMKNKSLMGTKLITVLFKIKYYTYLRALEKKYNNNKKKNYGKTH